MARLSSFTTKDFLKSAASLIADGGPDAATTTAILQRAGASSGSFYYRFDSRDQLLGELWLELVEQYQREFLSFLHAGDGLSAALFTPRWTRVHRTESRILLLYNKNDFAPDKWPETFVKRARVNATALKKGLQEFAKLAFGNCTGGVMRRIQFALMDVPYAAVRRHLAANEQIPGSVDDLVRTCYLALMPTMELGTTRIN
jgi:AcrR family transcriptional regulator